MVRTATKQGKSACAARKSAKTPSGAVCRKFFAELDGRLAFTKEIRRRLDTLKADAGVDSAQKEILAQRAIFIALDLESMEIAAAETGEFDRGVYTQMVNSLSGLLSKLGLNRVKVKAADLKSYVAGGDDD